MTVVAWDGVTLAADRMVCLDGYSYQATKVHRIDRDTIVGISGDISSGLRFVQWLKSGADRATPLVSEDDPEPEFNALVVMRTPEGVRLFRYEDQCVPIPLLDTRHALGAGAEYAAAALHLGVSAARAVEVACALCEHCAGGPDVMTLDDAPRTVITYGPGTSA
jgi:hypothetical protein